MIKKLEIARTIPTNSDKAFREIANFENYVNFIPGCSNAKLVEKLEDYEIGILEFDFLTKKYQIKSKNTLSKNHIKIEQIEGPFETFEGQWHLNPISEESCEAKLTARFKLPFLLDKLVPENVINSFCEAALDGFLKNIDS